MKTDAGRILDLVLDLSKQDRHEEVMLLGQAGLMLDPDVRTRSLLQEQMSVSGYWCGSENGRRLGMESAEILSLNSNATQMQRDFARQCSTWYSTDLRSMIRSAKIDTGSTWPEDQGNQPPIPVSCKSHAISVDGFVPVTASISVSNGQMFLIRETIPMPWGCKRHLHRLVRYDGTDRLVEISHRFYFLDMDGEEARFLTVEPEGENMVIGFQGSTGIPCMATVSIEETRKILRQIPRYGAGIQISDVDDDWIISRTNRPIQDQSELDRMCEIMRGSSMAVHPIPHKNWHAMMCIHHATTCSSSSDLVLHVSSSWNHPFLDGMISSGYSNLVAFSITDDYLGSLGNVAYQHADCTSTVLMDSSVSFVSCCDAAEQGVDLSLLITEVSRILKPGGRMMISFDYWQDQPETRGMILKGSVPRITDRSMVSSFLEEAERHGMLLDGDVELYCKDPTVYWGDMEYTVLSLLLRKI
jgi:hypothetical protein